MPSSAHGRPQQRQSFSNSLQDRINQLENLVVSLIGTADANQGVIQPKQDATGTRALANMSALVDPNHTKASKWEIVDQHHVSETFGQISLDNAETNYVGGAH